MILDRIENCHQYETAHPLFGKAFAFLEQYCKNPLPAGSYEICGEDLYARVQEYDTRSQGRFEVHNRYIDIQCVVEGTEKVYATYRDMLEPDGDYLEQKDMLYLKDGGPTTEFLLHAGEFAIFFPNDAHKPSMMQENPEPVKKVLLKIKV